MAFDLTFVIAHAHEMGASDVHISTGQPPIVRVRGDIVRLDLPVLTQEETHEGIYRILNEKQRAEFQAGGDLDFALELPGITRVRGNAFIQNRGTAAVFRLIPNKIPSLHELGLPEVISDLAMRDRGLVIVTGQTGSGKSTTLAAMVDLINSTKHGHIVTIEDPIEFVHESKCCLINQREVGRHTRSFEAALRAALREDPDVLLVGELRDLETTSLAITAAETGHLVLATLHTNSASKSVDRIIDVFPGDQQAQVRTMLSESLEGVIAQSLLPAKDGTGLCAALEILVAIPALRNMIREDKTTQIASVIQTGREHGMQSLDQSLRDLVMQGRLSRKIAMAHSSNPQLFEEAGPGGGNGAAGPAGRADPSKRPGMFTR